MAASAGLPGAAEADIIRTELTNALSARQMSKFSIDLTTNEPLENQLLIIADVVVRSERSALHYSNWHTWEAFRDVNSEAEARYSAQYGKWASMPPYANCLGMAIACYNELCRRLRRDTQLSQYADRVQLVTDKWSQSATSDQEYHCMAILRLPTHCIVMDLTAHRRGAIKIPLGSIDGEGHNSWAYVSGPGGARLLVEYEPIIDYSTFDHPISSTWTNPSPFTYNDPFMDIRGGAVGGVVNLAYPSAKNLYSNEFGSFPSRRSISFFSVWTHRQPARVLDDPLWIPLGGGEFLVQAGWLCLDMSARELQFMKVSDEDCLSRAQTRAFDKRLRDLELLEGIDDTLTNQAESIVISLGEFDDLVRDGYDDDTRARIQLIDAICHALGMRKGEVLGFSRVMLGVWRSEAKKKSRLSRRRRATKTVRASKRAAAKGGQRGDSVGAVPKLHVVEGGRVGKGNKRGGRR